MDSNLLDLDVLIKIGKVQNTKEAETMAKRLEKFLAKPEVEKHLIETLFAEINRMGVFEKKTSTEKAKNKKDKGPKSPAKRHPLAPLPSKDPKKKTPGVGNAGRM